MAEVVTGRGLGTKASEVCASPNSLYLAVAYWGHGAIEALRLQESQNVHIVLNVEHGGTNPHVLQELMTLYPNRVRVHGTLHAKILASENCALIGSANASASGLFLNGAGHAEAAVYLQGKSAEAAFRLAKQFYDGGNPATDAHLATCRDRFGTRHLSAIIRPAPHGQETAFEFFLRNQDVFGPMPVILSNGAADNDVRDNEWTAQQNGSPELPDNDEYDGGTWEFYEWNLADQYRGKPCLEIHMRANERLSFHVTQPILLRREGGTFARRLQFPDIGVIPNRRLFGGKKVGPIKIERLSRVHKTLLEKEFVCGWDVYEELGRP